MAGARRRVRSHDERDAQERRDVGHLAADLDASALTGSVPDGVAGLKDSEGGPILVAGSGTLVKALLANDLVDELQLLTFPVVVGGGLSIWDDRRQRLALTLAEQVRYEHGVVLSTYRPAR